MSTVKRIAILCTGAGMTIALVGATAAQAQLFSDTASTTPSSSVIDASSTTSSTTSSTMSVPSTAASTTSVTPTVMATPTIVSTGPVGEYLQIDGLTVLGVSTTTLTGGPVTILAANPAYPTMTSAGTVTSATTAAVVCTQFATDSASVGTGTVCPTPPVATFATTTTMSSSGTDYSPYTINVNGATQLLLDDRAPAALASIMPGDTINVYGYYTDDGSMDAEIVRDISAQETVNTATNGTTIAGSTTTMSSTAELQAELDQLETLVLQLEGALGMSTTTASTTMGATTTLPVSCPMIPAGSTSTAGCPPASSTITSSTIYE